QTASAIAADLKRAFHPAQPISDLMALIDDRTPANAWLTGLTIERGKPIQVRGDARTADDVASFVSALGSTPRLRDVKLLFNNSFKIENTQVVQFDIAATAVGNLPMPQPPKKVFRPTRAAVNTGAVTSGEGQ
ncbi:MAG TPA: PilN domain-containing protein, partial [Chthonomonadales bacterium]|nr:PilN domain-containing protein [Chthonomonadales bacterium]